MYAHGALPAGTILTGYIHGRDPWLERPRRLRLGGRRTVSGSADYQAVPLRPAEEDQMPNEWPGLAPPAGSARPAESLPASPGRDDTRLVIRLASPAVFVDAAGRPSLEPDPVLDLDGATVERRWARPATWSGWHAASRLPKPDEVCAIAGSTYRITGPAGTLRESRRAAAPGGGRAAPRRRVRRHPDRPGALAAARHGRARPASVAADAAVTAWLDDVRDLALDPPQLRWVADALRELQLARERRAPAAGDGQDTVTELLGRAAAGGFSGRQREQLRTLFTEPDPRQLRDLTTLVLAEQAVSGQGESR